MITLIISIFAGFFFGILSEKVHNRSKYCGYDNDKRLLQHYCNKTEALQSHLFYLQSKINKLNPEVQADFIFNKEDEKNY